MPQINVWQFESLPSTIPRKSETWHTIIISISKPVILEIDSFLDSCACSKI